MTQSEQMRKYNIRIAIGSILLILSIFFTWIIITSIEPNIEVVSITLLSNVTPIDDDYHLQVGDEVQIEITVKNQTHMTIRYLKINDHVFKEKDITYDLSYMEPDQIDDGTRKLTVIYIVKETDSLIQVSDVRLYLKGFIYVGHQLDLGEFGRFDLLID